MKNKDYDKKRRDLKDIKREGSKERFESTKHRKAFIDDVKRSFRSVKRSERAFIKKELKEIVDDSIIFSNLASHTLDKLDLDID